MAVPPDDMVFIGQDTQPVAPVFGLYVLYGQFTHVKLSTVCHPALQTQGPPAGPVVPALHTQSVMAVPASDLVFGGQDTQPVAPVFGLYVVSGHFSQKKPSTVCHPALQTQGPPAGPVDPVRQAQDDIPTLCWGEVVPKGHVVHTLLRLYCPARQQTRMLLTLQLATKPIFVMLALVIKVTRMNL